MAFIRPFSEVLPGPPQTSKLESFEAIVNGFVKGCKLLLQRGS